MQSVHDKPAYKKTLADMRAKLSGLQNKYEIETSNSTEFFYKHPGKIQ